LTTPTAHSEKHATLPPPQNALKDLSLQPSLAHQKPEKNAMLPDAAMVRVRLLPIKVLAQMDSLKPLTTPTAHTEKHATLPPPQNALKELSLQLLLAHQKPVKNAMLPDAAMVKVRLPPIKVLAQMDSLKKRPLTTPTAHTEKHATLPLPQNAKKDHSSLLSLAHQLPQLNAKLPDAAMPQVNPLLTEVPAHEHPDRLEASLRQ